MIVELSFGDQTATVKTFGATVISWKVREVEKLFLSSKSKLDDSRAIRGGIPIVFPQFGQQGHLVQHGFVRSKEWSVINSTQSSVTLRTCDDEDTRKDWGLFAFELTTTITLNERGFNQSLEVLNTGERVFCVQALLHTYLACENVANVRVSCPSAVFKDKTKRFSRFESLNEDVLFSEETDRVYIDAKDSISVKLSETSEINVFKKLRRLTNPKEDSTNRVPMELSSDVVVWNPWIDVARSMDDFGDDEYSKMLCVEPGVVSRYEVVEPNVILELTQRLECVS